MWSGLKRNFIRQQGFEDPALAVGARQYSALQFQGRIVLLWVVAGILFQNPPLFYVLGTVLWWSALVPKLNPFDAVYNATFGRRADTFRLTSAPAPRRTAQAIAGAFAWTCGLLIHFDFFTAAYVVEGFFLGAVLALTLGGFCVGSFVYHLLRGRAAFARRTLPWAS